MLDEILATKRAEIALFSESEAAATLRKAAEAAPPPRDFAAALRREDGNVAVIGEIKRRSPSKGELALDLDPTVTAQAYEAGGASALSVLTDQPFFGGSVDDLHDARAATALPVLRKDFVVDENQVYETRAIGADALLLIVAALPDDGLLAALHALGIELGLATLVEVHREDELDRALPLEPKLVGVNARDLATFAEDLGVAERMASRLPPAVLAVAESAIRAPDDLQRVADAGFDAVLVGEALVRAPDPAEAVLALATTPRRDR